MYDRIADDTDGRLHSGSAPDIAEAVVSVASDIAIVLDADGVVRSVAMSGGMGGGLGQDWVGRHLSDTVTVESRPKIEQLLRDATLAGISRRRQITHPSSSGTDVPVAYAAIRLGARGPLLAVGRDLRQLAETQQKFLQNQLQLERETLRRRQEDTRYRRLFHAVPDAMLVVDATTLCVVEANAASARRFSVAPTALPGMPLLDLVDDTARGPLARLLLAVPEGGTIEARLRLRAGTPEADVAVTPVADGVPQWLLRLRTVDEAAIAPAAERPAVHAVVAERPSLPATPVRRAPED